MTILPSIFKRQDAGVPGLLAGAAASAGQAGSLAMHHLRRQRGFGTWMRPMLLPVAPIAPPA